MVENNLEAHRLAQEVNNKQVFENPHPTGNHDIIDLTEKGPQETNLINNTMGSIEVENQNTSFNTLQLASATGPYIVTVNDSMKMSQLKDESSFMETSALEFPDLEDMWLAWGHKSIPNIPDIKDLCALLDDQEEKDKATAQKEIVNFEAGTSASMFAKDAQQKMDVSSTVPTQEKYVWQEKTEIMWDHSYNKINLKGRKRLRKDPSIIDASCMGQNSSIQN